MSRIAVIDYGSGNLRSVARALQNLGAEFTLTDDPAELERASALILPGQGAFADCVANLRNRGLDPVIRACIDGGKPYLGICLGLQVLFDESEEFGRTPGLGLLRGRVRRFSGAPFEGHPPALKVPHMGWSRIEVRRPSPLFDGIGSGAYFYFVHSFYCDAADSADVLASADHGLTFAASAGRDRVFGIQFHPEKSQAAGRRLLQNFLRFAGEVA